MASTIKGMRRAVLWKSGRIHDLGTPGGDEAVAAVINENGQITGYAATRDGAFHAFLWDNGKMTDFGCPAGYRSSYGMGISRRGSVVGYREGKAGRPAFLVVGVKMIQLGTLGFNTAMAYGVNNAMICVGAARGAAILWDGLEVRKLGDLSVGTGMRWDMALAVNSAGDIVGAATTLGGPSAFLWRDGKMTDLNDLNGSTRSCRIISATCISDGGLIAGQATFSPQHHAVLLKPIAGR